MSPPSLPGTVSVEPTAQTLAERAAAWLHGVAETAANAQRRFTIALAGGDTPRLLYETLAAERWRSRFDWASWHVYFGDERACPPDDDASNAHMARVALLDHVPIDPARVHRMPAERPDLDAAAAEYSTLLAATLPPGHGGAPRLDCVLLGLGENGHTASLFPGTDALDVTDRWATRGRADYAPYDRMTLTFPTLNAAAAVAFLVTGHAKRAALTQVQAGSVPAARVRPHDGALVWFLDADAAP